MSLGTEIFIPPLAVHYGSQSGPSLRTVLSQMELRYPKLGLSLGRPSVANVWSMWWSKSPRPLPSKSRPNSEPTWTPRASAAPASQHTLPQLALPRSPFPGLVWEARLSQPPARKSPISESVPGEPRSPQALCFPLVGRAL